ncbi:MAG: DNA methyltransferase [Myxococcota bacterium]
MPTALPAPSLRDQMTSFVDYVASLKGDEKGESQLYCNKLFQTFGHDGLKEAGATLEFRVRRKGAKTKFADLLWPGRVLIEMKSRGEHLERHYRQAFEYWLHLVPDRPQYVVLCNFDEFWIYDFNILLEEPVDKVKIADLPSRYTALNFLFLEDKAPVFKQNMLDVTREAADAVAGVFNALIKRNVERTQAQRFVLQCVVAMFAEDFELLPRDIFTGLVDECRSGKGSSYDLISGLFRQMDTEKAAPAGRYKGVRHFNGGLFAVVDPLELTTAELKLLAVACSHRWIKVHPAIFGTLFQKSMDKNQRHALGAHFTNEAEIQKVVLPTIVRPWRDRIDEADSLDALLKLRNELLSYRVLDPACGSGNFLYVAFREIKRLELDLLTRIFKFKTAGKKVPTRHVVKTTQFFGMDKDPFAVELAKVTLILAKELAIKEMEDWTRTLKTPDLPFVYDKPLPLDNLDKNIFQADAVFDEWPRVEVIIGNPPYQSKNKVQDEYGPAYMHKVREKFPNTGMADYCVYWFRRAHDHLEPGQRAGLVGTNTIRQTNSREASLDYIVGKGGTITEAVSTQVWPGDAVVHVSIVNWIKGEDDGEKTLWFQRGDKSSSPFDKFPVDKINSALSLGPDLSKAKPLTANQVPKTGYQGQTPGNDGYLLTPEEAAAAVKKHAAAHEILFPYLIGDEMLSTASGQPSRFVIDLHPRTLFQAREYKSLYPRLETVVLPAREKAAAKEAKKNKPLLDENPKAKVNRHHAAFLKKWWLLSYARADLLRRLATIPRYIACSRVTRRPIFVFVDASIHPSDALGVFILPDDYSFGILQSTLHFLWFAGRCSTFKADWRYTSTTVWDSFPWPQNPTLAQVKAVAAAAIELRQARQEQMDERDVGLREVYRALALPGASEVKDAQAELDAAVRACYGFGKKDDGLEKLKALNEELAALEKAKAEIVGPGLPPCVTAKDAAKLVSDDCIQPIEV